ncbi:anti-sigma factor [Phycicoccus sp.]|uniref:anti-sigma factor n=1 Tax=Phycicoccus sp. TaxID=1902410 RepID=UPI002B55BDEB|nr:anti-sigma factor [Phycicoccus sp.]HMM96192.1 anti-sigma factor [Phycicoccus sp.]
MSPDLHHLSGAYAVDALDGDERTAFEQHLTTCAACRAEVGELTAAAHTLGALTEVDPPESLRASVLAGVARVRPLPPLVGASTPDEPAVVPTAPLAGEGAATALGARVVPLFRRTSTWLAAAAAAVVLAVGGLAWSPWSGDQPALTAVQQVEQASDAATVTSHKGDTTATLAYSRSLDRSAITVTGLSPAPSGKVYQLWYITADGARSAGFISAADDGTGEAVLGGSLSGAQQVGVTVEPAGGSAAPTSAPIMAMALT